MTEQERQSVIRSARNYRCQSCGFGIDFSGVDEEEVQKQIGTAFTKEQVLFLFPIDFNQLGFHCSRSKSCSERSETKPRRNEKASNRNEKTTVSEKTTKIG